MDKGNKSLTLLVNFFKCAFILAQSKLSIPRVGNLKCFSYVRTS